MSSEVLHQKQARNGSYLPPVLIKGSGLSSEGMGGCVYGRMRILPTYALTIRIERWRVSGRGE